VPEFELDGADLLVELAAGADGVIFGVDARPGAFDPRAAPLMTVAWRTARAGETLEEIVAAEAGGVVLDREPVAVRAGEALRTFAIHKGPGGLATASEQWRVLARGRCWTVTAMSALGDQPLWGPVLAAVAATFTLP
jgi:hypothetical protein